MCNSELLKNYAGEVLIIRRTKDEIMNIGNIFYFNHNTSLILSSLVMYKYQFTIIYNFYILLGCYNEILKDVNNYNSVVFTSNRY